MEIVLTKAGNKWSGRVKGEAVEGSGKSPEQALLALDRKRVAARGKNGHAVVPEVMGGLVDEARVYEYIAARPGCRADQIVAAFGRLPSRRAAAIRASQRRQGEDAGSDARHDLLAAGGQW